MPCLPVYMCAESASVHRLMMFFVPLRESPSCSAIRSCVHPSQRYRRMMSRYESFRIHSEIKASFVIQNRDIPLIRHIQIERLCNIANFDVIRAVL